MTRAERYADRKARKVCVGCGLAAPRRGRVRCARCAAKAVAGTTRWAARHPEQERDARIHRQESLRWSNPEVFRADDKARRRYKIANGLCKECPRIAEEGKTMCTRCLGRQVERCRRQRERLYKLEQREVKAYAPLDEITDLNRVRVLRGARRLDWFDFADLREALGCHDSESVEANTLVVVLTRMFRGGLFERRETKVLRSAGARYDYRITPAGIAYLDAVLGGRVIPIRRRKKAA